jgi:hypothetical protein
MPRVIPLARTAGRAFGYSLHTRQGRRAPRAANGAQRVRGMLLEIAVEAIATVLP